MRHFYTILLLTSTSVAANAQSDSTDMKEVDIPFSEYTEEIYNPETETKNTSYNYSNKWDFDGDEKNDSLLFIGNGGAHTYFYLQLTLSSDGIKRDFPNVQLDMPYPDSLESLKKWGKHSGVQLVVDDLDLDGISEIYLNFDNPFGAISAEWNKKGIKSKYVVIDFKNGKLIIKDYN